MKLMKKMGIIFFITAFLSFTLSPVIGFCEEGKEILYHKATADGYLRQGQADLAIFEYKKALELGPSSTAVYFNLAIAYYSKKDIKGAIWALERLVEIDDKDVEARYNLACLSLCERDIEKALLHLELAKSCCDPSSGFEPLIQNAFLFIGEIKKMGAQKQDALFLLLQQGLPLLSQA